MIEEELLFLTFGAVMGRNRGFCSMIEEVFLNPPFGTKEELCSSLFFCLIVEHLA